MNKLIFLGLIIPIFMLLAPNASAMLAYASSNECSSIVGCYGDGYEQGKDQGANDWIEGREHDSSCPPNDSLSFCTGYKVGYEVSWGAAKTLG
jgi:hypothetical protein